jgi:hypothetical protein
MTICNRRRRNCEEMMESDFPRPTRTGARARSQEEPTSPAHPYLSVEVWELTEEEKHEAFKKKV